RVIVQYDQTGNAYVVALSGKTGEEVWRTARNVRVSWASPILVNTGKREELILAADPMVVSYNPATGKEIWKMECISGEVGPSLAYTNGIVFSVNEYSKLAAIQIGDPPKQLWEDNEYLSDVPSPVATDQYLFLATSYGTVACYDAKSGTKFWEHEFGNQTYSSPILAEGKIYLMNSKGVMYIFKADKTFSLVGQPQLGEGSFCTPAFRDGRIFIRVERNLFCIGK
ncbi:MAG: PQQ-binding-like beta-propeller repeat protein, partial [Bacteroidota bacterium]